MKRLIVGGAFHLLFLSSFLALSPFTASAHKCNSIDALRGLHFARQWTSTIPNAQPTCDPTNDQGYYGWNAVNGQIGTPSITPTPTPDWNYDHIVAALFINFAYSGGNGDPDGCSSCTSNGFMEAGWFLGTWNVDNSGYSTVPQRFVSYEIPGMGDFTIEKFLPLLGYQATSIFRIYYEADQNDGQLCWHMYYNYNVEMRRVCQIPGYPIPTSGKAEARGETYNAYETNPELGSSITVDFPRIDLGYSDPNSNNALRVHGGNGWQPWDASLTVEDTRTYDERFDPIHPAWPTLCYSPYVNYYKFRVVEGEC